MARPRRGSIPLPGLRWRGLNLQLFLLIFLPLTGVLLVVTFGSLKLHQDAMRTLVGDRDERAVRAAASAMSEQIDHRISVIQGLALRATDQVNLAEIINSSAYLQSDFDHGLAFISPDGVVLTQSGDPALWANLPVEFTSFLDDVKNQAGERPVLSPVLLHPTQDENILFAAFTTDPDLPIAVGAFSPAALAQDTLSEAFTSGVESAVYLVSPDLQIIYHVGNFSPSEDTQHHPGIAEALRGESGTSYIAVDGGEHVVAYSPIQTTGWALVIEEPWHAVASPLLNTTQLAPLVLVPVLLLALIALWFGARQIIRPLQALEIRAANLAWGNYQTIGDPVGGIEEIVRLQQTLIHLAEKVQHAQTGLRSYIGAITTGQEDERQRLARELHDDTIQSLIALNQQIHLAQFKTAGDPEALATLVEIQKITETIIQDLRRVIHALRPLYLEDLGLATALNMLAQETMENIDIPIQFIQTGKERRLPPETELALYRIAQEGINNILHHAQATKATLEIDYSNDEIQLSISDNGCGFDIPESPAEFAPNGHYGLLGIHERTELIGAKFLVHSSPDEGTNLLVTLVSAP